MDDIDFNAKAALKKWPSQQNERAANVWGNTPYLVFEGTLDQCIKQFLRKAARHLYEIHTEPQQPLVSAVLQADQIVELSRQAASK